MRRGAEELGLVFLPHPFAPGPTEEDAARDVARRLQRFDRALQPLEEPMIEAVQRLFVVGAGHRVRLHQRPQGPGAGRTPLEQVDDHGPVLLPGAGPGGGAFQGLFGGVIHRYPPCPREGSVALSSGYYSGRTFISARPEILLQTVSPRQAALNDPSVGP